jgi:hypothetical protein
MSELFDPPRLAKDPNAGALGDWFREGQEDLPSAEQLARVAKRLEPALGNPPPSPKPLSGKPLTPWLLGALGAAGIGLLALALRGGKAESPPAEPKPTIPSAASTPSVSAPASGSALQGPLSPTAAAAEIPPTATASAPSPSNATRNTKPHGDGARPALSEAALLEQARSALASDPARALALTRQHQARFPNGILRQEREVIAIEALRRLGRGKTAAERAGSFEQAFPDSAHRRAVESGLSK